VPKEYSHRGQGKVRSKKKAGTIDCGQWTVDNHQDTKDTKDTKDSEMNVILSATKDLSCVNGCSAYAA